MRPSIRIKLDRLAERYEEVGRLLADPSVSGKSGQFRDLSMEYSKLESLVANYRAFRALEQEARDTEAMANGDDPELREMASEELKALKAKIETDERELELSLIPKDSRDDSNIYVEIRAGAGGDEAAIFAGDLFRMYSRYADRCGWTVEILSENRGEHGGYREVISRLIGRNAFARLKFESGTHRVQRVPATEAQGRIHTSTCTVAILPELTEVEDVPIADSDLRVDTYRASGAGGQHVNKTDSAVRMTHIPTGIVVECQDERSQHKNRSRALSLLKAKLLASAREKQEATQAAARKLQVGTGDRSERIRTYNFPQGRLTDHRVELTLYKLEDIIGGNLDEVIDPLQREYQTEQLAALSE